MTPPIEIMVMCRLLRPGLRWPSCPDPPPLSAPDSAMFPLPYAYPLRAQLTRYARYLTTAWFPTVSRPGTPLNHHQLQDPRREKRSCTSTPEGTRANRRETQPPPRRTTPTPPRRRPGPGRGRALGDGRPTLRGRSGSRADRCSYPRILL